MGFRAVHHPSAKKTPFGQGRYPNPKGAILQIMLTLFALGFAQNFLEEGLIHQFAFGNILAVLDEIDRIGSGDLLGVEGAESEEGLPHHVGSQPMSVNVLGLIPVEFLLVPDTVDGHNQAAREEIGKGPADLFYLCIEEGEVIFIILQLIVQIGRAHV